MPQSANGIVFTFLSIYYKHGESGRERYTTLRKGLDSFLDNYFANRATDESEAERYTVLSSLDDTALLTKLLDEGLSPSSIALTITTDDTDSFSLIVRRRIENEVGYGLVAVVAGPTYGSQVDSGEYVYLEQYYKHGEWAISTYGSDYLDQAMQEKMQELGEKEWNQLSDDEKMDAALERSEADVSDQRGWGVTQAVPGILVAQARPI